MKYAMPEMENILKEFKNFTKKSDEFIKNRKKNKRAVK